MTGGAEVVPRRRGHIWREPWVDCGACSEHTALAPRLGQTSAGCAREYGWRSDPRRGWLCPRCEVVQKNHSLCP